MTAIGGLARRKTFEAKHPEVIITPDILTLSGKWEASMPGTAAMAFDDPDLMFDFLEEMFSNQETPGKAESSS
jgi:hypothetical protein